MGPAAITMVSPVPPPPVLMPSFGPRCLDVSLAFRRLRTAAPALPAAGAVLANRGLALLVVGSGLAVIGAAPQLLPRVLAAAPVSTATAAAGAAVAPVALVEAPPLVRVLIRQQASLGLVAAASPLQLTDAQGHPLGQIAAEQPFQLQQQQQGALVVVVPGAEGQGETRIPVRGDLWIVPQPAPGRSALVKVEGQLYRGRLQVRGGGDGRLLVINQLPLELYLPSVVGSEMPAAWPQAALRAQAVAARTYAISQLKPQALFDLKATVDSQMYRGVAAETDSTRSAVAATRSLVLMQGNALINAVFHSSSGGSTENSGEVWSRQFPYLVSVPDFDESSPMHQWQLRIEPEQLRRVFRETDGVNRIDVLAVSRTGRIRRARVSGPAGSLELSGAELRQRLGLRSTLVKAFRLEPAPLERQGVVAGAIGQAMLTAPPPGMAPAAVGRFSGVPGPVTASAPGSSRSSGMGSASAERFAGPAQQRLAEPFQDSATGAIARALTPPPSPPPPLPPLAAAAPSSPDRIAPQANPGRDPVTPATLEARPQLELVVEGRGFGHGVGMSQWGAYAMALQGRSYDQILRHYYRGVELRPYENP